MMWDRIFQFFERSRRDGDGARQEDCDDHDAEKMRKRQELERREREARRMNDALEGIVHTIQHDRQP